MNIKTRGGHYVFIRCITRKTFRKNVKIVLPEGEDERVLTAATQLQATDYVTPVLLGNKANVEALATEKV